jgi:predicted dienelactone hydrolase
MKSACASLVLLVAALGLGPGATPAAAAGPQPFSQPGVDAPELAALGPFAVGVRSMTLIEPAVPDVLAYDKAKGSAPLKDRPLLVDVWYPAKARSDATRVVYRGDLPSEAAGIRAAFTVAGIAVRDAPPETGAAYPLVILSHGYSGTPVAMSWLAENLASKGYVVAAAHHEDPPITDQASFAGPLLLRPLDIAFVAHVIQARAKGGDTFFGRLVDPDRVALAGYSMGGYGVLTAAGAALSPLSSAVVPGGYLSAYALGGAKAKDLHIEGLKAVVAISPAGGSGPVQAWGPEGLKALRTPALFIVGDQDKLVGYSPGVKSIFEGAVNAPRYMLVYKNGAHSIGMNGAPDTMRSKLWDLDWFEDPVWRKERVIGVNLHMITAFLDLYVKGDRSRAAYLDLIPSSNDGVWPQPPKGTPYGGYSPGSGGITVWKGFQRVHSAGLEFYHQEPAKQP